MYLIICHLNEKDVGNVNDCVRKQPFCSVTIEQISRSDPCNKEASTHNMSVEQNSEFAFRSKQKRNVPYRNPNRLTNLGEIWHGYIF